jgi:hypothetical protein
MIVLMAVMLVPAVRAQAPPSLAIGAAAPLGDQKVTTTFGDETSINEARLENGLMVVFTCNTCPWVDKWEGRYHTIAAAAADADIGVLLLNSNEALRDGEESMDAMREREERMNYTFPYAVDPGSVLADAFGASRTPEIYLFDRGMKLIYHGAIDDNARDVSEVESPFLLDAIAAYKAGRPVSVAETSSIGCTIKRKRS